MKAQPATSRHCTKSTHTSQKAVGGVLNVQPRVFVMHADAPMTSKDNIQICFASCETLYKGVEEVLASRNVDLPCDLQ